MSIVDRDETSGRSLARWAVVLVFGCLVVLAIALPLPDGSSSIAPGLDEEDAARAARLARVSGARQAALADWRAARGLTRWRESGAAADSAPVRFDASVPDSLVATLDSLVRREWTALGDGASGTRTQVFVYADTTDPVGDRSRRATRTVVLPESSGGRCVVLVHLPVVAGLQPGVLTSPGRLLGPCGYVAVFGAPGSSMRAWLARTGWLPAASSAGEAEREFLLDPDYFYSLPADAAACATQGGATCIAALSLDGESAPAGPSRWEDGVLDASRLDRLGGTPPPLLGVERQFLADVRRDAGPARFATLWRADGDLSAAFTRALGEPVDRWTSRWLRDGARVTREAAAPGRTDVLWVLGLVILGIGGALPRERTRPRDG